MNQELSTGYRIMDAWGAFGLAPVFIVIRVYQEYPGGHHHIGLSGQFPSRDLAEKFIADAARSHP